MFVRPLAVSMASPITSLSSFATSHPQPTTDAKTLVDRHPRQVWRQSLAAALVAGAREETPRSGNQSHPLFRQRRPFFNRRGCCVSGHSKLLVQKDILTTIFEVTGRVATVLFVGLEIGQLAPNLYNAEAETHKIPHNRHQEPTTYIRRVTYRTPRK